MERKFPMKGLFFTGPMQTAFRTLPDPIPAAGEVVVDIKAAGLCGSDLHNLHSQHPNDKVIMGHEGAGVVSAVGPGVTTVKTGERVALYHAIGCGRCHNCMSGYVQLCTENRRFLAGTEHGTFADKVLVKEMNCLPLPDDISFAVGAFIGCFAGTSFSAMKKLAPSGRSTVAVFGLGPVGLAGVAYARALGARVIGIDGIDERLALARCMGCEETVDFHAFDVVAELRRLTDGRGPDLLYESSGSLAAQRQAIEAAAIHGSICMVGYNGPMSLKTDQAPSLYAMIGKELTLMGSSIMPHQDHYEIIDLLRKKHIDLEAMVTHRFPLDCIQKALCLFDTGKTGKIVIDC
jgi:threonine dehydrogenase-like Zn-dependent dehydrogenase